MRSVLSRCSLLLPLLCALMVASQTNRTVRSYKNNLYVLTFAAVAGSNVSLVSDSGIAGNLTINPRPDPDLVKYSSFYSKDADLYVGVEQLQTGATLTWVTDEYKWRVAPLGGLYQISDPGLKFLWYDGNDADSANGTITLVDYDSYSKDKGTYWLFGLPVSTA